MVLNVIYSISIKWLLKFPWMPCCYALKMRCFPSADLQCFGSFWDSVLREASEQLAPTESVI